MILPPISFISVPSVDDAMDVRSISSVVDPAASIAEACTCSLMRACIRSCLHMQMPLVV